MNSHKKIGRILGFIPIPPGSPFRFFISNLILSFIIEECIGTYFISFALGLLLSYDMYKKNKLRIKILEDCVLEETFMQEELSEFGVGEFQYDSDKVNNEDRDSIFENSLWINKVKRKSPKRGFSLIFRRN